MLAGRTAGAERHRQRPRQHQHQQPATITSTSTTPSSNQTSPPEWRSVAVLAQTLFDTILCFLEVSMQIIVKTFFGGREIPCTVEAWDTVDHLKAVVQDNAGIPTDEQQLFWGGMPLDGSRTLADYAIQHESTIYLGLRAADLMRGGTHPSPPADGRNVRPRIGGPPAPVGMVPRARPADMEWMQVRSVMKVELMRQYSWSTTHSQYRWACPACTSEWGLYPIHPEAVEAVNAFEIAIHFGNQLLPGAPWVCSTCNVEWR